MSQLQRLGRTFASDATIGDVGRELLRQGSNYATKRLIKQGPQLVKKIKSELKNKIRKTYLKKKQMPLNLTRKPGNYSLNPVKQQSGRASMRVSGKVKTKRTKKVKVSSALRKKVKAVIAGGKVSGTMDTIAVGTVGIVVNNVGEATSPTFNCNANIYGGEVPLCVPLANDNNSSQWVYWAGMADKSMATIDGGYTNYWQQFEHFSPYQIMDAASKMWNKKFAGTDSWYLPNAANIITDKFTSNGDPAAGGGGVSNSGPIATALKLDIVNSYAKYTLKNTGQRALRVQFFNCTPKIKFPGTTALSDLRNAVRAECAVTSAGAPSATPRLALFTTEISSNSNPGPPHAVLQHPAFDPKDSSAFRSRWNYQMMDILIQPGETCVHNVQGPRNTVIDYAKIIQNVNGNSIIPPFVKGYNVSTFCRIMNDLVTDTTSNLSGHLSTAEAAGTIGIIAVNPLAVEVKTFMHLKCPEQAGFIAPPAFAAGAPQTLDYKRPRKIFENYTPGIVPGTVYKTFSEEQPGTEVVPSVTN